MKAIIGILTCLFSFAAIAQERAFDTLFYQYEFEDWVYVEGLTINNVRVGEWTYTPNDSFKIVGSYKDGKVHGPWYFIENHDTNSILNFKHGVYHGQQTGYYHSKEGKILFGIENFVDGYRHGLEIKNRHTGEKYDQLFYSYGKPTGVHTKFNKDGSVYGKIIYENCTYSHFDFVLDSNQTLIIREEKIPDTDTTLLCIYRLEEEQRIKIMDMEYVNQLPNGRFQYYNDQGQTIGLCRYKNGVITKEFRFFTYKKGKRKITFEPDFFFYDCIPHSRYFPQPNVGLFPFYFFQSHESLNRYIENHREETVKKSYMVNGSFIYYLYQLNQFGEIINVSVEKTNDPAFDEYLTNLIYSGPNQRPYTLNGIPVVSPNIRGMVGIKTIR